jgi:hypothetical protein
MAFDSAVVEPAVSAASAYQNVAFEWTWPHNTARLTWARIDPRGWPR